MPSLAGSTVTFEVTNAGWRSHFLLALHYGDIRHEIIKGSCYNVLVSIGNLSFPSSHYRFPVTSSRCIILAGSSAQRSVSVRYFLPKSGVVLGFSLE